MNETLKFPVPPRPAVSSDRPQHRCSTRIRELMGSLLNRLGVPGFVRPVEFTDKLTGRTIQIDTGPLFTRVCVDGRDYYFKRLNGRYDGSGMGCGG